MPATKRMAHARVVGLQLYGHWYMVGMCTCRGRGFGYAGRCGYVFTQCIGKYLIRSGVCTSEYTRTQAVFTYTLRMCVIIIVLQV